MKAVALLMVAVGLAVGGTGTRVRGEEKPAEAVGNSVDVAWLEKIAGSKTETETLKPQSGIEGQAKMLRTAAYARLGALGTPESLAAVERIEAAARKITLRPAKEEMEIWVHPCWHFQDITPKRLAEAKAADGTTWAVVGDMRMGNWNLFLISSKTPEDKGSWSRGVLADPEEIRGIEASELTFKDADTLVFTFTQQKGATRERESRTCTWSLKEVLRDSDGDEWTDLEEKKLGLDPQKADTDGDGIADGKDVCPDFAADPKAEADEKTVILQKAFFATFGISGGRHVLLAEPKSPKVHFWGYGGPVLYKEDPRKWREKQGAGEIIVSWSVEVKGDTATVEVGDYEGPLAGSGQTVRLKKIGGKWYVVARKLGGVA